MAEYGNIRAIPLFSSGDMVDQQYHIVKISNGDKQVSVATSAADEAIVGVLQNAPGAVNRPATVAFDGLSKVVAGAAVNSVGVYLTTNSSGRAIAANTASGHVVIGRSMSVAGGDGHVMSVLLTQPMKA